MQPDQFASIVAAAMQSAMAPLVARIAVLEKSAGVLGRDGRDGGIGPRGERGLTGGPGVDGKDAPAVDLQALARQAAELVPTQKQDTSLIESLTADLAEARAEIKSLRDVVPDLEPIKQLVAEQVAPLVTAKDVEAMVDKAVASLPKPLDGTPGEPGPEGPIGSAGPVGPAGPQGELGPEGPMGPTGLEGLEGRGGRDGQPGVPGVSGRDGEKGMDGAPGRDGTNGTDGLGFDDFEEVMEDGGRVVLHRYTSGERVKEFRHITAVMIHRGLYKAGQSYLRGDVVLWGNSSWHAIEDTKAEPGAAPTASRAWVLVARKGDVGKSGPKGGTGDRGPQGPEGPQGRSGY